jgi:DNA ligase (NAD+)
MSTIKISAPTVCPFCGSPVVKQLKDGAHLYCSNKNCKERLLQQLNYFVTKQCMNIDGLSEKTLRKLQDAGLVNYWYDLYSPPEWSKKKKSKRKQ